MKFRRILEVFALRSAWKSSGRNFTIYASKNEAFCCEVQTHFESTPLQSLQKKFWAQFHDLCVQKRSCSSWSSDKFWKMSACKVYRKSSGRNFSIYASKNEAVRHEVQTHFGRSPFARFTENLWAHVHDVCRANKHSWLQHFVKMLWARFTILHAHKFFLCCWNTLWCSWLSNLIRMLWVWTHLDCECTHKLWRAGVTLCEAISNKSCTGTSVMFCNIWTSKEWAEFVNIDLR